MYEHNKKYHTHNIKTAFNELFGCFGAEIKYISF